MAKKRYAKIVIGREPNGELNAAVVAANGKIVWNTGNGYNTVQALCKSFKYLYLNEIDGVKFKPEAVQTLTTGEIIYITKCSYYAG